MSFFPSHDFPGFDNPERLITGHSGRMSLRAEEVFRCYPVSKFQGSDKSEANYGGKLLLPSSFFHTLVRLQITYPMLFELNNLDEPRTSHAGVQEFTAEEGRVYLPDWLMASLNVKTGDIIKVKSTDLPLGTFIRLQPQSSDFLQITNPRAVLERAFRNFSCLTTGDTFVFSYNNKEYAMEVLEVKPAHDKNAICTMETDLSVDFAPPVGYEEQASLGSGTTGGASSSAPNARGSMAKKINYQSLTSQTEIESQSSQFSKGGGQRLGGNRSDKASALTSGSKPSDTAVAPRSDETSTRSSAAGVPTYTSADGKTRYHPLRLPPGQLFFGYDIVPLKQPDGPEGADGSNGSRDHLFKGTGQSLRKSK